MKTKRCIRCSATKPLAEYYAHREMADGRLNKCKECCRKVAALRYVEKREHIVAYESARGKTAGRRLKKRQYSRASREREPHKYKARNAVNNALRDGRLLKTPCIYCGSTKRVEAHHADYGRPLDVEWTCFKCHREIKHGQKTGVAGASL